MDEQLNRGEHLAQVLKLEDCLRGKHAAPMQGCSYAHRTYPLLSARVNQLQDGLALSRGTASSCGANAPFSEDAKRPLETPKNAGPPFPSASHPASMARRIADATVAGVAMLADSPIQLSARG